MKEKLKQWAVQNDFSALILGVDPGSQKIGLAALELPTVDLIMSRQIILPEGVHGRRYAACLDVLQKEFETLLQGRDCVVYLGMEGPAIYGARKNGLATTLESRAPVHMWWWNYTQSAPIIVPPTTCKKALGLKGTAKKELVSAAVSKMFPDRVFKGPDELDAVAVSMACAILLAQDQGFVD